ncbi:hypothetical protein [Planctomicrobium sp. SH664]|uniref:hypothetical protein n=1 Tax=Planctomicrobium sp. SH664 TaxID=3448125 RepID=UPI003F5CB772
MIPPFFADARGRDARCRQQARWQGGDAMGGALRVLQAGDFRLHEPLQPVCELPESLREIFVGARERSARKVFETAVSQRVDLLLLTGVLANVSEDPRAAWFLTEQFRRLQQAGIDLIWAVAETPRFPAWASVPANVRIVTLGEAAHCRLRHSQRSVEVDWSPIAADQGHRWKHADVRIQLLNTSEGLEIHYGVAGRSEIARHLSRPTQSYGGAAHLPGGMWLTACDLVEEFASSFIETETVTWVTEVLPVTSGMSAGDLRQEMLSRLDQLETDRASDLVLVRWQITGEGELWDELINDELLQNLSEEVANLSLAENSFIWSWKIERAPAPRQVSQWTSRPVVREALVELEGLTEADVTQETRIPASHLAWGRTFQEQRESNALALRLIRALRATTEH